MTQTAHTPGPWTYQYSPYPYRDGDEIPAFEVHGDEVKVCDTNESRPTEEQEANARLIAAAPEMFEQLSSRQKLLEKALEEITIGDPEKAETYIELALTEGAAAIAKAKGGAA